MSEPEPKPDCSNSEQRTSENVEKQAEECFSKPEPTKEYISKAELTSGSSSQEENSYQQEPVISPEEPDEKFLASARPKLKIGHEMSKDNYMAKLLRNVGNAFHKERKFFEALNKFNDALCFAVPGGEEVALAYGNRSAVYMDLKRYKLVLKNIRLAREHGYPTTFNDRLKERETRCLKSLARNDDKEIFKSPFDFFKLSYAPNPKVPFLAKCLEMNYDKQSGAHLVTNFNLKSGDIIAITDGALKFVDPLARLHRCSWCAGDCLFDLSPCPGCPQAMYCSDDCLKKGRLDFHYKYCKLNESLYSKYKSMNVDDPEVFITEKIYSRLEAMFDGNIEHCTEFLELNGGKAWNFFDFDWRRMDKDVYEKNLLLIMLSKHKYRESIKPKNPNKWLGSFDDALLESVKRMIPIELLLSRFISVPFEKSKVIHSGNKVLFRRIVSNFVGKIVSPLQCFTTVSCVPNAEFISVDNKLVLMVLRPIRAGERILVSIGGITFVHYPKEDRQKIYRSLFDTACPCVACRKNWKCILTSFIRLDPTTDDVMAMLRCEIKTKDINKFLPEAKPGLQQWILLESIVIDAMLLVKPSSIYP